MARILVADDSLRRRRQLCQFLKAEGHEVVEAVDAFDCLEKAFTNSPDCILTDLLRDRVDGMDILAALRENGIDVPTIVIQMPNADETDHGFGGSFARFLKKPIKMDDFRRVLNDSLAHQAA